MGKDFSLLAPSILLLIVFFFSQPIPPTHKDCPSARQQLTKCCRN
jgi:hypothetical protein